MQPSTYLLFFSVSVFVTLITLASANDGDLELLILHNNDMHARFEETERNSGTCKPSHRNKTCIGGFARTAHEIRKYRKMADEGKGPKVLYLNAGDSFVGTAWFTLFTYNITSEFVNLLRPDAVCLGNHEFDNGPSDVSKFIDQLEVPVVTTNIDFSNEPQLQGKTKKSLVIEVSGRKIGIVSYLTPDTSFISRPGNTTFQNEIEALRNETEKLAAQNISIIIALGHSGYEMDKKIAKEVELIDVIIGGHSHSLLWTGDQPDSEPVEGPYPTVITQESGKKVPIVQVYANTKYFGKLYTTFDKNGELVEFRGEPELLESNIDQETDVLQALEKYRSLLEAFTAQEIGSTLVELDGNTCRYQECNFGNLITDAMVTYVANMSQQVWTEAPIGLLNGGGIRNSIDPFDVSKAITMGDMMTCLPFRNNIVVLSLKGYDLKNVLEQGIRNNGGPEFLQVSGLRVTYDRTQPVGSRVAEVRARCGNCTIPQYQPLNSNKNYRIITIGYLSAGGDNHTVLRDAKFNYKELDTIDVDLMKWYFNHFDPAYAEVQGRISFDGTSGNFGLRVRVSKILVFGMLVRYIAYL